MVKEFGEFFGELVKDYLVVVEGYELVETEVPYSFKHQVGKIRRFPSPSDIDVVGMKRNQVTFVSCRESTENQARWTKDVHDLRRALDAKKFKGHKVRLAVAFARSPDTAKRKSMISYFKAKGVRVLLLQDMITRLLSDVRSGKKWMTYGRYAWFLKYLNEFDLLA
jgi:hypothetical protein